MEKTMDERVIAQIALFSPVIWLVYRSSQFGQ
jgi:hypothetical protein